MMNFRTIQNTSRDDDFFLTHKKSTFGEIGFAPACRGRKYNSLRSVKKSAVGAKCCSQGFQPLVKKPTISPALGLDLWFKNGY
jgi:hypothetical protein